MNGAKLYSWVDVDARLESLRLRGDWPNGLGRASAYYDGLLLYVRDASAESVVSEWLEKQFLERYQTQPEPALILESPAEKQRRLPVHFEILDEEPQQGSMQPATPSWKRLALLPLDPKERAHILPNHPQPFPTGTPPIVAFYSFKGGVGRTVHLCALLRDLHERRLRTLVIDADLEAPGISVLAEKNGWGTPEIALVDLLALAHGEPVKGWPETLALCAQKLRSQPLRIGSIDHYLLATYRDQEQALRLDVRPEHLTQTPQTAWHLGELFAALGRELKVDAVLIDLRAGLSELASSLLFDSRLHRILVTTTGVQAREGTQLVLQQLGKLLPPSTRLDLFDPEVVLSMLNQERLDNEDKLESLRDDLESAYPTEAMTADTQTWRLQISTLHQTKFYDALLNTENLSDLLNRLGGGLAVQVHDLVEQEWKDWLLPPKLPSTAPIVSLEQTKKDRQALVDAAKQLEYAEQIAGQGSFLVTKPLRALAQRFAVQPPLAIVLGPKGAGKTFLFMQVVARQQWTPFVEQTLGQASRAKPAGWVWPLAWSRQVQLGEPAFALVRSCADQCLHHLYPDPVARPADWTLSRLQERVARERERGSTDETSWRSFWFSLLAESLGIAPAAGIEPIRALVPFVQKQGVQLVVLLDGLEELFPKIRDSDVEQVALRALLQGVPERLSEIPGTPLGLLVVVRQDVAAAAITQNFGQFERTYDQFLLRWSAEEALRLALWLVSEKAAVSAVPQPDQPIDQLDGPKLSEALYGLWGSKIGRPSSKEARSAVYVLSVLSDFQGRVQARDMVRLIRRAAELSLKSKETTPLLVPSSMRQAPDHCGQAKLHELLEEIAGLDGPIKRLQEDGKPKDRRSPFDPKAFGLSAEDVQFLEATGLVKKDGELYWLTELLRRGLGFPMRDGRRPRIVNL